MLGGVTMPADATGYVKDIHTIVKGSSLHDEAVSNAI